MRLTQNWVSYLDRSYQQIKQSVIRRLTVNTPEISDHSEGNLLIVLISIFSGIGEMLNYYIDGLAREVFLGTARKYESVVRLSKLIAYTIKARSYPTADLLFTLVDSVTKLPVVATQPVFIPRNTIVTDVNGYPFITLFDQVIVLGQYAVYSTTAQYEVITDNVLGQTDGTPLQKIILPLDYVHNSMKVRIDGQDWKLFASLGLMLSNTKGFVVIIEEDGNAYIQFGDGVNGKVPDGAHDILCSYKVTEGVTANLPPGSINVLTTPISTPAGTEIKVSNPDYSSGGSDFETIEEIRNFAPRSIRTLDRAVTYQDYIDCALMVPGVGAAEVSYCCGKFVDVYVIPKSKGNSTLALLNDVQQSMNCKKMITTSVQVKASGLSKIWANIKIYGNPLYTEQQIRIDVINQLDLKFGFATIVINEDFSVSDLISELEKLPSVDSVEILQVKIQPYARPIEGTNSILNIEFTQLPTTNTEQQYTLVYRESADVIDIYKGTYLISTVAIGQVYADAAVSFKVNSGSYITGDRWQFSLVPSYPEIFPNGRIVIKDYTAPIIDVGPLVDANTPRTIFSEINIITQGVSSSCLPPCN